MPTPAWAQHPPKIILLATDLSCRSDRPLDRAADLAELWNARLVVLTVLEADTQAWLEREATEDLPSWRRPPDRESVARAQLIRDLPQTLRDVEVIVRDGDPPSVIAETAKEIGAELVVTGVARDEPLGRQHLGATVERLVRSSPAPVLVVRSRLRPYEEVLVGTDFSESSGYALLAAARFFPDVRLTALHAWEVPYSGLLGRDSYSEQWEAVELQARDEFLSKMDLSAADRARLHTLSERGQPDALIRAYMQDKRVDLAVIGSHGAGAMLERLIGSTAKRILRAAPGDVLVIREPRAVKA